MFMPQPDFHPSLLFESKDEAYQGCTRNSLSTNIRLGRNYCRKKFYHTTLSEPML
jgi:hypothetical protein